MFEPFESRRPGQRRRAAEEMATELEHVREIAERVAASYGLELVEAEFRGGGQARMLRLYIDRAGGVSHEDCANVSREVGTILDVEDAVSGGSYVLEVSSPGLDRKLLKSSDYERFAGSRIRVTTREPVEGSRHFEGRLEGLSEGRVRLELAAAKGKKPGARQRGGREAAEATPGRKLEIELGNVEKANLVPEF